MRRKDRMISDLDDMMDIVAKCDSLNLALFDKEYPYVIPLNFGVVRKEDQIVFYFHGANAGKKLSLIHNNNKAGFSMDCAHRLVEAEHACNYTMEYESVTGNGTITILEEEEKELALTVLMQQYCNQTTFSFDKKYMQMMAIYKLEVNEMVGKALRVKPV